MCRIRDPEQLPLELSVQIGAIQGDGEPTSVPDVIPLAGRSGALPLMLANCPGPEAGPVLVPQQAIETLLRCGINVLVPFEHSSTSN